VTLIAACKSKKVEGKSTSVRREKCAVEKKVGRIKDEDKNNTLQSFRIDEK
jgi:hypothetical protein